MSDRSAATRLDPYDRLKDAQSEARYEADDWETREWEDARYRDGAMTTTETEGEA